MTQAEFDPATTRQEQSVDTSPRTRRERRRIFAEKATSAVVLLPEIGTTHEYIKNFLENRVIGQGTAIEAIVSALDRSEVRDRKDNRPIATLAFLGPTGVGKTELAMALSEVLSFDEPNLIHIEAAAYSHGHEVASLTGSPPGYIGGGQEPLLSSERVEQDGTVILIDEIEKGSMQLHNLLLHITDTGELTLGNGTLVSFRNAVIIMTSNLGAREMVRESTGARAGFSMGTREVASRQVIESAASKAFAEFFSPEFAGRTELVVFHSLDEEGLHRVLDVKLDALNRNYQDDFGVMVRLSPTVRERLVERSLENGARGARAMVDALDKEIRTPFGRYVMQGYTEEGTEVHVYHRDELADYIAPNHQGKYIFAARPNPSIRKKDTEALSTTQSIFSSGDHVAVDLSKVLKSE